MEINHFSQLIYTSMKDFYLENRNALIYYLTKRYYNMDIEGIVDESFVKCYKNYDESKGKRITYLYTIAENECKRNSMINLRLDIQYKEDEYILELNDLANLTDEYDTSIDEMIDALKSDENVLKSEIFILYMKYYNESNTMKKICDELNEELHIVKNEIYQIKQKLRKKYSGEVTEKKKKGVVYYEEYKKNYYQENKEKIIENSKNYYKKNKEKILAKRKNKKKK